MAANEFQESSYAIEGRHSSNEKAQMSDTHSKRGGWITFSFITGTLIGLTLAAGGWGTNLIVYLIEKFHFKSIVATQIGNIVNGSTSLLPVLAAIIADSMLGCYSGILLLALTAALKSLRPQTCVNGPSLCPIPTKIQFAVLYMGIVLASIGQGGTRSTIAAMGANQFDNAKDQAVFFNWYVVILYASAVLGSTVIVYIEDSYSWALGFGICVVVTLIGLAIFLLGNRYYRHIKPQGSPFTSLARVIVAATRKRNIPISSKSGDYYTLKTEGDTNSASSIAKPWRLCSVQQVEDLKSLIRICPILSSGIFLSTPIGVLTSLTVLQALTVDRHLGPHFKIPAGTMIVFTLASTAISLTLIDRILYPIWQKLSHQSPTPLQRIALGHVFNALGMFVAALVESKRLKITKTQHPTNETNSTIPMSVLWLVPQMAVVGIGEAFHYPGQVTLYYQEFPTSLRSTSTAMHAMIIGIAYYMSNAVIGLTQRTTGWLPDNINNGRLDNVYWMLLVVGVINFGYYLICARFYRYQNVLNRAALKTEGDVGSDGLFTKPWRICIVQQVEDLKTLIRISPLWSSNIFLGTAIGVLTSLTILQKL
ncbi:protein nrt1/ ptr family 2.7 [Quercus suber]|uniref:Protein nrt1/ ptr family 2.7 n=1 Tax=Quercus suber TaxID=58331 RepID=A0AAW0KL51_QUESU